MSEKDQMPDEDPRLEIARTNVKMAIALRDTNAAKAARAAGMGRNGVSQFTSGATSIKYENMLALCDVLNVPIGLMHKQDAITQSRLRLYRLLERLERQPEHLVNKILADAIELTNDQP